LSDTRQMCPGCRQKRRGRDHRRPGRGPHAARGGPL